MYNQSIQPKTTALMRRQRQSMLNATRLLSTHNQVRQAGLSKPAMLGLAVLGAGAVYYQQRSKNDSSKYRFTTV
jgi:hypothetical protein